VQIPLNLLNHPQKLKIKSQHHQLCSQCQTGKWNKEISSLADQGPYYYQSQI
jgi:hypothetical protein